LSAAEGRKFGLLVGGAFLVLGWLLWRRGHAVAAAVCGTLGGLLLGGGLAVPTKLGPVYRVWMKLAHAISKVTTPVFMSLLYFLVITPAGLVARLVGYRPVTAPRGAATYWRSRPEEQRRGAMDHQF
jgi:hypothetical protein